MAIIEVGGCGVIFGMIQENPQNAKEVQSLGLFLCRTLRWRRIVVSNYLHRAHLPLNAQEIGEVPFNITTLSREAK